MKKIMIISNSISGGGAERTMRTINFELNKKGINSTLLCLNNSGSDIAFANEIILDRKWKSGVIDTFRNFREFVASVSNHRPGALIVNCELPELFVALLPFRVPTLICVEHTSKPWAGRKALGACVRFILKLRHSKWATVNRDQVGIWPYKARANYIPNPVQSPLLSAETITRSKFVFLGRLRTEKGVETILEAISAANASIDIFGTGNLEVALKEKFHKFAHFHGFVPNAWTKVHQSQTLIIASEYEGDGMVVVEAILAGLPILLLDNKDLRRFQLPDANYFKDSFDLAKKISLAMNNCEQFRVTPEKINEYKIERELELIVEKWLQILG